MKNWFCLIVEYRNALVGRLFDRCLPTLGWALVVAACIFVPAAVDAWQGEVVLVPNRTAVQPGEEVEISIFAKITLEAGEQVVGLSQYEVVWALDGLTFVSDTQGRVVTGRFLYRDSNIAASRDGNSALMVNCPRTSASFLVHPQFGPLVLPLATVKPGDTNPSCILGPFETLVLSVDGPAGSTTTFSAVNRSADDTLISVILSVANGDLAKGPVLKYPTGGGTSGSFAPGALGEPISFDVVQPEPEVSLTLSPGDDALVVGRDEGNPVHILNVTLADAGGDTFPGPEIVGFTIDIDTGTVETVQGFQFILRNADNEDLVTAAGTADGVTFSNLTLASLPEGTTAGYSIHAYGGMRRIMLADGAPINFALLSSASDVVTADGSTVTSLFTSELSEQSVALDIVASTVMLGGDSTWDLDGAYDLSGTGQDAFDNTDDAVNLSDVRVEASIDGGPFTMVTLVGGDVPEAAYTRGTVTRDDSMDLVLRACNSADPCTNVNAPPGSNHPVDVEVIASELRLISGMLPGTLTHENAGPAMIVIHAVGNGVIDADVSGSATGACSGSASIADCVFTLPGTFADGVYSGVTMITADLAATNPLPQSGTIDSAVVSIADPSLSLDLLGGADPIAVTRCMAEGLMIREGTVGVYDFSLMDLAAPPSTKLCDGVTYDIYYAPRVGAACPTAAMVRSSGTAVTGRMPDSLMVTHGVSTPIRAGTAYCVVLYAGEVASDVLEITTDAYDRTADMDGDGLPDALDPDSTTANPNAVSDFLGTGCNTNQLCDVNSNGVPDIAELYYGRPAPLGADRPASMTIPVQADGQMAAVPAALSGAILHTSQRDATELPDVAAVGAQLPSGTYWLSQEVSGSVQFTRLDIHPAVRGNVLRTAQNLASADAATHNLIRVWLLGYLPLDVDDQMVNVWLDESPFNNGTPITAVGGGSARAKGAAAVGDEPSSFTLGWTNAAGNSTDTRSLTAREIQDRAVLEAADGVTAGSAFTLTVTILGGALDSRLAGVQLSVTNGSCDDAGGSVTQFLGCTVDSGATGSVIIALMSSGSVIVGETSVLIGSAIENDADLDRLSGNDESDERVYFGSNSEDNAAAAGSRNYLEAAPGVRVRAGVTAATDSEAEGIQFDNAAGDAMIDFELYCTSTTAACRNQPNSDVVVLYFSRDQREGDVAGPEGADRQVAGATAGACPALDSDDWGAPQTDARYQCYRFAADFRISGDGSGFGAVPSRIPTFDAFGGTGGGGGSIGLFGLLALFGLSAMSFLFGALRSRRVFTAAAAILAVPLFAGLMSSQAVAQTSVGELMDDLSDVRLNKLRVGVEYGLVGYDREYTGSAQVNGVASEINQREVDDSDSGYRLSASWDVDGNRNSGLAIDVFWADYGGTELRDMDSGTRAAVDVDGYGIGLSWYFPLNFGEMTGVGGDGSFYVGFGYADTDASVAASDEFQFIDTGSESTYLEFGVVWEELIPVDNLAVKLSYHWFDDAGIDFFGVGLVYDFGEPSGAAADRPRRRTETAKRKQVVGPQPQQQRRPTRRRAASRVATGGACANWNTCSCLVPLSGNPKGWYVQVVAYKSSDGQRIRNMERRLRGAGYQQVVTTEKSGSLGRLTLIRIGDPSNCREAEGVKRRIDRMFDVDSLIRPYQNSPK